MLCSLSFFIFGLKIDKIMTLTKKSPQTDVNSAMSSSFARGAENICGTGKCRTENAGQGMKIIRTTSTHD